MHSNSDDRRRADTILELHRPVQAELLLRQLLASEPDSSALLQSLAQALMDQQRCDEATNVARAAVAADPGDPDAHVCLSAALIEAGTARRALGPAREAVRLGPTTWQTHYALGRALCLRRGNWNSRRALAAARMAIQLAPTEPDPHVLAGVCLSALGRSRAAGQANDEALRLNPMHTTAVTNEASAQINRGRLTQGGSALSVGLALAPADTDLHQMYDEVLLRLFARLAYAGSWFILVLTGMLVQAVSYPLRLVVTVAGTALAWAALRRVLRRLPPGSSGWIRGLWRRRLCIRWFLYISLAVVAGLVLWLGLAPWTLALPIARGLVEAGVQIFFILSVVGMIAVTRALSNRL